jgi:hypothetical protein
MGGKKALEKWIEHPGTGGGRGVIIKHIEGKVNTKYRLFPLVQVGHFVASLMCAAFFS